MANFARGQVALIVGLGAVLVAVVAFLLPGSPFHSRQNPEYVQSRYTPENTATGSLPAKSLTDVASSLSGDAVVLLEDWLQALAKTGLSNPDSIQRIAVRLRSNPNGNAAFYGRVRQIMADPSLGPDRKLELIIALDRAATPAALGFLIELEKYNLPESLRQSVLNAIASAGEYYWDQKSLDQAIPLLQQAWNQSADPDALRSIAKAMSRDVTGIEFLIETILSKTNSPEDPQQSSNPWVSSASTALQNLQDPGFVPVLQRRLQSSKSLQEASLYATTLAGMPLNEAAEALLSWARGAGDGFAPVARDAFSKIGPFGNLQDIISAVSQDPSFKSNLVKAAILTALNRK
jgi:hypothetical protein